MIWARMPARWGHPWLAPIRGMQQLVREHWRPARQEGDGAGAPSPSCDAECMLCRIPCGKPAIVRAYLVAIADSGHP